MTTLLEPFSWDATKDHIALALYQLGFVPTASIAFLRLHPGSDDPAGAVRGVELCDLAAVTTTSICSSAAGAGVTLPVIFCDDLTDPEVGRVVAAVSRSCANDPGMCPTYIVTGTLCGPVRPTESFPYVEFLSPPSNCADIYHSPTAVRMVISGHVLASCPEAALADWLAPPVSAKAGADLHREVDRITKDRPLTVDELADAWRDVQLAHKRGVTPRIMAAITDVSFRDLLICAVLQGPEAIEAQRFLREPGLLDDCLAQAFSGQSHATPNPEYVHHVKRLCVELTSAARPEQMLPILCVLAFCAWWQGSPAIARQLLNYDDSMQDYRLGQLLFCALEWGVAPGWLQSST